MKEKIINFIKRNPLIVLIYKAFAKIGFKGTINYWEGRYKGGGSSGDGSYGELAAFKATAINDFIGKEAIKSAIEFGCGDGNQLSLINYPVYLGLDVSKTAVELCCKSFCNDKNKAFLWYDPLRFHNLNLFIKADVTLSLDVIYHIIEDDIYESYMKNLFGFSRQFVIIYSSNEDYNINAPHIKHRKFTAYIEKNYPEFILYKFIKNELPNKSHSYPSDFYIFKRR